MLLNPNQTNCLNDDYISNYDSLPRNRSITGFVRQKLDEMNLVSVIKNKLNLVSFFVY